MSVKRSRVGSSSNQLSSPVSSTPAKLMKPDSATAESSKKLLTFASAAEESDPLKIGGFLELCPYCKKRISQNSEVFMYRKLLKAGMVTRQWFYRPEEALLVIPTRTDKWLENLLQSMQSICSPVGSM